MFVRKKIISNDLTRLIKDNPYVDIEEVLLHKDFSVAIRKESDILYKRILKKTEKDSQWFNKIVKYALFNASPPTKYKNFNSVKQINLNSSNFLENCGQKFINYFIKDQNDDSIIKSDVLQDYLKETIIKFTSGENIYNHDPMFAGNFQRFIENFLQLQALDTEEIINYLTPFLVSNIRILAYQQLIITILCHFYSMISHKTIYKILTCILNRAFIAVKYIYNQKSSILNITINERIDLNIPWKKNILNSKDKFVKYKDIEDAEIEAYLTLMSIRECIKEENDIVDFFRDDDLVNEYPLIQALLYCGTRCPDKSIISLEAFKILDTVFNGSESMEIKSWKLTENEKNQLSFYTEYADEMIFDSTNITYKMIHSLPIFWSHRYNFDEYKLSDEEKTKVDISDYYNDDKTYFRERVEGETAFEIIQPLLICEPPVSSQLFYSTIDIFFKLSIVRKILLKTKPIIKVNQDSISEIDGIVLDFFEHHFKFGRENTDKSFSELIKYEGNARLCFMKYIEMTPLNGFIVDFFLRFESMKGYISFFQVDHDKTFTKMGQSKCRIWNNNFNISSMILIPSIKLMPINLPEYPGFFFTDDDEKEEEEENDIHQINNKADYYTDWEVESKFYTKRIKIGEGSTSIAYKVSDTKMKTSMCKKVIKYICDDLKSFEVSKKALRELDIRYNIPHPCICKLIGINFNERIKIIEDNIKKETTTIALLLEFVDYKLSDILEMQISNTTKTRIVLELAHVMNFLHKHGIMHRNLKIGSIMINNSFETKLVKFHYASDIFSDSTNSLTKEMRELAYISPELASGKEYDNKTDVYSFGAVIYEIFTGKPPIQSLDDKIKGKKVKLSRPSSSISKFCIKLIQRCLSYSSSKRPSFNEILNEMRANSYKLAPGVDSINLFKRDKELKNFEKFK